MFKAPTVLYCMCNNGIHLFLYERESRSLKICTTYHPRANTPVRPATGAPMGILGAVQPGTKFLPTSTFDSSTSMFPAAGWPTLPGIPRVTQRPKTAGRSCLAKAINVTARFSLASRVQAAQPTPPFLLRAQRLSGRASPFTPVQNSPLLAFPLFNTKWSRLTPQPKLTVQTRTPTDAKHHS
jgi:hypothetical protein